MNQMPAPCLAVPAPSFTPKQGQYLAFIYAYIQLNGRLPAEADLQNYFRVTPPSIHQMVLTPERAGLIRRLPGIARSISSSSNRKSCRSDAGPNFKPSNPVQRY